MEDYNRSRSYANGMMQIERYNGPPADLRSYSTSCTQTRNPGKDMDFRKGKNNSKSSWLSDPEFQRKRRVASYKRYSVEGKVKGSLTRSFRWLKNKCTQVVYSWW